MSFKLINKLSISGKSTVGYSVLAVFFFVFTVVIFIEIGNIRASDSLAKDAFAQFHKNIKEDALRINKETTLLNVNLKLYEQQKETSTFVILVVSSVGLILLLIVGIVSFFVNQLQIAGPVKMIQAVLNKMKEGEDIEIVEVKRKDEIGAMQLALNEMIEDISSKTVFANEIGKGNYNSIFDAASKNDGLGNALLSMRENLQKHSEEERKRNWSNIGIAELSDILRQLHLTSEELYDQIMRFTVKYLGANQGILFEHILDEGEPYLKMAACYAYDKKKYFDKKILKGEGLVGQCLEEKDVIYITEVPKSYFNITSGLGAALPSSICFRPLMINENVIGVLELAFFKKLESFELDFIGKMSDSIAATMSGTKVNERTKVLLEESHIRAEELKAQEEEMRQNLEELQATQEDFHRVQEELKKKNTEIEEKVSALEESEIGMLELKISGTIISVNNYFLSITGYKENEVVGKHYKMFFAPEFLETSECQDLWYNMRSGDLLAEQYPRVGKEGNKINLRTSYKSVCDTQGFPYKILCLCFDLTGIKV